MFNRGARDAIKREIADAEDLVRTWGSEAETDPNAAAFVQDMKDTAEAGRRELERTRRAGRKK